MSYGGRKAAEIERNNDHLNDKMIRRHIRGEVV